MRLTDRDYEVLEEVERFRVCDRQHILRMFFSDSTDAYCQKRMYNLSKNGFLKRHPVIDHSNGAKRGVCYSMTDKGLAAVGSNRSARDNMIEHMRYIHGHLLTNRMYLDTQGYWEWVEAREAKRKYSLNRTARLSAVIRSSHAQYALYVVARKQSPITLSIIQQEIDRHATRTDLTEIVVMTCPVSRSDYLDMRTKTTRFHVLDINDIEMLRCLSTRSFEEDILARATGVKPEGCDKYNFCRYTVGGEPAIELLSNDMSAALGASAYAGNNRNSKVLVAVPEDMVGYWESYFNNPKAELIPISR